MALLAASLHTIRYHGELRRFFLLIHLSFLINNITRGLGSEVKDQVLCKQHQGWLAMLVEPVRHVSHKAAAWS